MDENIHNSIDGVFKEPLEFYADKPAPSVWDNIERQLDKDDTLIYKARARFLLGVCACLFLLLVTSGIFFFIQYNHPLPDGHPGMVSTGRKKSIEPLAGNPFPQNNYKRQAVTGTPEKAPAGDGTNDYLPPLMTKAASRIADTKYNTRATRISNPISGAEFYNKTYDPAPARSLLPSLPDVKPVSLSPVAICPPGLRTGIDYSKKIIRPSKRHIINRLSITSYYSNEFAGYNLTDNDATGPTGREIEKKERNVFSASAGFYLNYAIDKKWVLQSGLSYSWSNSMLDPSESFAVRTDNGAIRFKVNTVSGYGYLPASAASASVGDSALTGNVYSNLHYLSVPLIASYKFDFRRFSLLTGAGVTFNFLTGATVRTKLYGAVPGQDEYIVAMNGLKKVNCGVLIKAELQYHINTSWELCLVPCFKSTLSPVNINSSVPAYPYNFGIGLGVNYRL